MAILSENKESIQPRPGWGRGKGGRALRACRHPRDHSGCSGRGCRASNLGKVPGGCRENAAQCWSQRHERCTSSAVSPVTPLPLTHCRSACLEPGQLGTAWLLGPAGLGSHVSTQTQLPYASWESPPFYMVGTCRLSGCISRVSNGVRDKGSRSRHRKRVERPPLSTLCKGLGGMTTCKLWDGPRLANIRGSHSNPGIKIQSHFVLWDKDLGPLSRWMDTARPEEGQAGGGCYSQREGPEGEMALL